jgi:hypothetical protein
VAARSRPLGENQSFIAFITPDSGTAPGRSPPYLVFDWSCNIWLRIELKLGSQDPSIMPSGGGARAPALMASCFQIRTASTSWVCGGRRLFRPAQILWRSPPRPPVSGVTGLATSGYWAGCFCGVRSVSSPLRNVAKCWGWTPDWLARSSCTVSGSSGRAQALWTERICLRLASTWEASMMLGACTVGAAWIRESGVTWGVASMHLHPRRSPGLDLTLTGRAV